MRKSEKGRGEEGERGKREGGRENARSLTMTRSTTNYPDWTRSVVIIPDTYANRKNALKEYIERNV